MSSIELLEQIREDGLTNSYAGELIEIVEVADQIVGEATEYSQPIEAEVAESLGLVEALLPNMSEQDAEFFNLWLWQEQGHANTQLSILNRFGRLPQPTIHKVTPLVKAVSIVTGTSAGLHEAMEVGVLTYMALGELETKIYYTEQARKLMKQGERDLARVFGHQAYQEGLHLQYQRTEAQERYAKLRDWQKHIVRTFIERQYRPVGVKRNNHQRMQGFGNLIITVSSDGGTKLASTVQALATELVKVSPTSNFVARRYKACIDELREC
ncbi:MAG: hypothetical protein V4702_04150 [Patescibacteria group bacterium]